MEFDPKVDNEKVFDDLIAPLVKLIADVCRMNNIPVVMALQYKENALYNLCMVDDNADQRLLQMGIIIFPENFLTIKPSGAKA